MIIVTWLMGTPLGHIVTLVCICSKLTEENTTENTTENELKLGHLN